MSDVTFSSCLSVSSKALRSEVHDVLDAAAALHDVVVENLGVVLLFLKLYLEPAGDAALALGVAVGSHGQIEVGRPKFGIDLRIERVFYTFVKHNI